MAKVKVKAVLNNGYLVHSKDIDILMELLTNDDEINWYNFANGSYYYSDRNIEYILEDMDEENKILTLVRCD